MILLASTVGELAEGYGLVLQEVVATFARIITSLLASARLDYDDQRNKCNEDAGHDAGRDAARPRALHRMCDIDGHCTRTMPFTMSMLHA